MKKESVENDITGPFKNREKKISKLDTNSCLFQLYKCAQFSLSGCNNICMYTNTRFPLNTLELMYLKGNVERITGK